MKLFQKLCDRSIEMFILTEKLLFAKRTKISITSHAKKVLRNNRQFVNQSKQIQISNR